MKTTITEGQSVSKPPYFDGTNYNEWKERMKIFIQSVDFKLWLVIKNGSKIAQKIIEGKEFEKSEDEFDDEEMKIMEQEAKAKNILWCAVNPDAFKRISSCKIAKEMWEELDREVVHSTAPASHPETTESILYNHPDFCFVEETSDAMENFLNLCVPLHKLALEGNWPAAKQYLIKDIRLRHAAIARGLHTVLHVAAGANQFHFVKELLAILDEDHIRLQDFKGDTAFCFAAAAGNFEIVDLMLLKNPLLPVIRSGNGYTPIQFAAFQGRCKMTWHLYNKTIHAFQDEDWKLLFFTCIYTDNYHLALKIAREKEWLAFARDENRDTALHLLAQNQKPLDSCCHCPEHLNPIMINPGMKNHVVFQLVKFLWTTILRNRHIKSEIIEIISEPSKLLFDAAEVGNFGFLSELVSAYPSLIWEVDSKNQSIIHIAVLHRHATIYNLIHEIGPVKDIIVTYEVGDEKDGKNTLLHLAAKLAPPAQLELVSGAAFQMCRELLWFEEVKKIMPAWFKKMRNSEGLTAQELFTREHEGLRKDAVSWMKCTAEFCMLMSTVIATGVFSAAISVPGGTNDDQNGKPNYLEKTSFLVFAISDASALVSSATAMFVFLSILVSRYAEYDFHRSLPLKLIFGLLILFISVTSMMIAFCSAFFITYWYGLNWVPAFISVLAFLLILLFLVLQYPLWKEIICTTLYFRNSFKPREKMIYVLEK